MDNKNISETLNLIVTLQKNACCGENCPEGCTRPFLGPTTTLVCYNTRPVTLTRCCVPGNWEFPYEINGTTGTSTIFRVENVENNCATFRVLIPNTIGDETTYTLNNSYFTIDLDCVLALQCLPDVYAI